MELTRESLWMDLLPMFYVILLFLHFLLSLSENVQT